MALGNINLTQSQYRELIEPSPESINGSTAIYNNPAAAVQNLESLPLLNPLQADVQIEFYLKSVDFFILPL